MITIEYFNGYTYFLPLNILYRLLIVSTSCSMLMAETLIIWYFKSGNSEDDILIVVRTVGITQDDYQN